MSSGVLTMRCMVRVNGVGIGHIRLRRTTEGRQELLVSDPEFGMFPIDNRFDIEICDMTIDKTNRKWERVTYKNLVKMIESYKIHQESSSDSDE